MSSTKSLHTMPITSTKSGRPLLSRHGQPPNKRLKLAGGDRFREAECCALARRDCRPTPLRRRASRPQLKRDPLGGSTCMITVRTAKTTDDAAWVQLGHDMWADRLDAEHRWGIVRGF